jgi:PKD domain/Bacterial Ig-like domain (group 1)
MVETMFTRITFSLGVLAMLVAISCDRVPLLAPTNSTLTIDAGSRVVETGGSTSVSAMVIEQGGTPVHNGTVVRFTTTLGRLDPVEAQTRNGVATTTFLAGNDSGVAEVRATSGGAGGSSTTPTTPPSNGNGTTTTTATNSNVVLISVGSAAVDTVTVRANPSSVSTSSGATVSVIATVIGTGGRLLPNIPVSFSASRGTLSSTTATTDAQGEARVTLNTNGDTDISVAAGTKTATTKITGVPGPSVSLTCSTGTGQAAGTCASATAGQPVTFTAQRAQGSGNITSATLDFGDNSSVDLGTLSSSATIPHSYAEAGTYTARLTGTDGNGESSTAVQVVIVTAAPTATVSATVTTPPRGVTATATTSVQATSYSFNWGDGQPNTTGASPTAQHTYTGAGNWGITMTATLSSGATVTATTFVTVQ